MSKQAVGNEGLQLKRRVGLLSGVGLIVGNMIGSGIFINPGGVLQRSGSVGFTLVIWLACGLLSIFGALSYAELGTLIPKSGGEYSYFMDGLGKLHGFWGPLPAFFYSWGSVLFTVPASIAIGCLSCAGYTVYPIIASIGYCPADQDLVVKLTALVYLGLVMALNCYSVNWTIRATNVLTLAKLAAIVVLIGCGIYQMSSGQTQYLARGFEDTTTDSGSIAMAFYAGLWSYYGWNALNYITEEMINPAVNLPRAIILGLVLVTCCYLAVNVAYLSVLDPETFINSNAVAVDLANTLLGPFAFVIPLAVVLSTFGGVLSSAFVTSRLCFASAREGHMIDFLSYVQVESRTPFPALLFTGMLAGLMIVFNDMTTLIDFFSFVAWIFIVLAMIVLLLLRKTRPNASRPYQVPLVIPIVTGLVGCYLVAAPLILDPTIEYLYVLVVFFVGFIIYIPFVYYKCSVGWIGPVTRFVQLILKVAPTATPATLE